MSTFSSFIDRCVAILDRFPVLEALAIIAGSVLIARCLFYLAHKILPIFAARTLTAVDDQISEAIRQPVSVSVVLGGCWLALMRLRYLGEVPVPWLRPFVVSILLTLAILVWARFAIRLSKILLEALSRNQKRFSVVQSQTLPIFENFATIFLIGATGYFLLLAWKVEVSGWVASAGIAGLALSLAAKDSLANLFAGISILADVPFKVGDFVVLETGERGEITRIGLRSSRLMTRDDIEVVIPNTNLANSKIINEAGGESRKHRVRVQIQVAYGTDIDRVRALLLEIAGQLEGVCKEPTPRVRFRKFLDSGLLFELLSWIEEPVLRGRVLDALNSEIYKQFAAHQIEIPFPKHDVYVHTNQQPGEHADQ